MISIAAGRGAGCLVCHAIILSIGGIEFSVHWKFIQGNSFNSSVVVKY